MDLMKFVVRSEGEEASILPDTSDSETLMNNDERLSSNHPSAVAPKRTINETGTIVLTPGTEGEPSQLLGESNLAEESQIIEDETPSKRRRGGKGGKKFRAEWLSFDMFKGWLRAHPNPERAMCTACNIVLNAGKSELEKHATSIKHQKRVIELKAHQRYEAYEADNTPNMILVDATAAEGDNGVNATFLQRHNGVYNPASASVPLEALSCNQIIIHHWGTP